MSRGDEEAVHKSEGQAMPPLDQEQDVTAGIVRAFEEAAGALVSEVREDQPDAVRMLDEAFERAQVALGTNVLAFKRLGSEQQG